jgi:peptidoglycan/LPS O-acetylase OafA/YrhL
VLAYHAGVIRVPGGFLGVDLFFVISGFLITSLLIAEVERSGRIAMGRFYLRRARRLLPALGLMLAVTTLAVALFWPHELSKIQGDLAASMSYVTNWWFIGKHQSYFQASGRQSPFQHLWSLAVEEQFYLVWPLVMGLVLAGRTTRRKLTNLGLVGLAGAVASTAWMAVISVQRNVPFGADASRVYMGTDTHAMGVLLGASAAAYMAALERGSWGPRLEAKAWTWGFDVLGAAGGVAVCYAMVHWSEFAAGLYRGGFLAFSGVAALCVVGVSRSHSLLGAALDSKPIRWVGTRSYALYLWHWPIFVFTRPQIDVPLSAGPDLVLRLALTFGAAEASYRLVERPIRVHGVRHWFRALRRIASVTLRWRWAIAVYAMGLLAVYGVVALVVSGQPGGNQAGGNQPVATTRSPSAYPAPMVARLTGAHPGAPPVTKHGTPGTAAAPAQAGQIVAQATPPAHAAAPPPLTAVGDSVMLGAATDLQQSFPGVSIDAVEGRQASNAITTLNRLLTAGKIGPAVVLQTGTNGSIDPGALNALLTRLSGRRVILLNVHVPRPWQNADNATLVAATKAHSNVDLVDWNAAASAHPGWFWDDGTHLRPAGAQQYTDLIVDALKS